MKKLLLYLFVSFDSLAPARLALRANLRLHLLCALCVLGGQIHAATIEAVGRAAGDLGNAREIALADALREAVRQGTGLDVLGSTSTKTRKKPSPPHNPRPPASKSPCTPWAHAA